MIDLLWLLLFILLLSPVLRALGHAMFAPPGTPLPPDPGPLVDSEPTTMGAGYALARLSRASLLGIGLVLAPAVVAVALLVPAQAVAQALGRPLPDLPWWLAVGLFAALGGASVPLLSRAREAARGAEPVRIEVYADRVRFPVASLFGLSVTRVSVPLANLHLLHVNARDDLVLGMAGATLVLSRRHLAEPGAIPRLHDSIAAQVRRLPGGEALLARSDQSIRETHEFLRRPARMTRAVLAACAVAFAVELLVGMDEVGLFRLGANVRSLSWHGEWFRLFTASFLHVGLLHIAFNLFFISIFGGLVERLVGPWRFLVIYLASSAIGAAVASGFDPLSAGASTGAFGLLGALGGLQLRFGNRLPIGFRLDASNWVVLIGLNAALPLLYPGISWSGHLGGLVGGALVCALATPTAEALDGGHATRGVRTAAGLLVAVQLVAFGLAAEFAMGPHDFQLRLVDAIAEDPSADPLTLNNLAWSIAVDPEASPARLAAAVKMGRSAAETGLPELKDTLAQALHRVGDHDGAVRIEAEVVLEASNPVFATQLRRFLLARIEAGGGPLFDRDARIPEGLQPVLRSLDPPVVEWEWSLPADMGRVVYSIGRPGGLLEICVEAGADGARAAPIGGDRPPDGTGFEIAYVGAAACPDGRARFFAAADPETSRLP